MSDLTPKSSERTAHRLKRDAASLFCNLLIFGAMIGGLAWMHAGGGAGDRFAGPSWATTGESPASQSSR